MRDRKIVEDVEVNVRLPTRRTNHSSGTNPDPKQV